MEICCLPEVEAWSLEIPERKICSLTSSIPQNVIDRLVVNCRSVSLCLCRHLLFMVIQPMLLLSWNSRQYKSNVVLHILGCLKCCFNTPELLPETEHNCFWLVLSMHSLWFRCLSIDNCCCLRHTSVTIHSSHGRHGVGETYYSRAITILENRQNI